MNKSFFTLIFLVFTTANLLADEFEVKSFEKAVNDLSARTHSRNDVNDNPCALIRILTDLNGLSFDSNSGIVGNIEKKTGEYWLYVSAGERQVKIMKEGFIPLNYNLPETINEFAVYRMVLTGKNTNVAAGGLTTGMILIQSVPEGADVYIDDIYKGKSPFQQEMKSGYYKFMLSKKYFYEKTGDFKVLVDSTEKVIVKLDPKFGSVNLSVIPAGVASKVFIDGFELNQKPPFVFDTLQSGAHTITLETALYEPVTRDFTVEDNKTTQLEIPLKPIFGNIEISAGEGDQIFIDGTLKGSKTFTGILMVGIHTIEIRRDKFYTDTRKINIEAGKTENLQIALKPIVGSLSVLTTPPEADIIINNQNKGKSPKIINDLIIGNYEITLKKEGFATVKTQAEIKENERTTVNENMSNFREVRISSNPSTASLIINKKDEGSTPKTLTLPFGENTIRLEKTGYQTLEQKFTITEQQREYSFTMLSDAKAMAKADFYKYKKQKNYWLAGTIASAGIGGYFYYSANKHYDEYKTATNDAEDLHDQIMMEDKIWPAAFVVSGLCGVMTYISAKKQGKARKKMDFSAVPVEGGGMVMVRWNFE
jgi:hypothetical protein